MKVIELGKDIPLGCQQKIEDVQNNILCGDVVDGLRVIPDGVATLVWTSPPYNVDIKYGSRNDNDKWQSYLDWLFSIWTQCHRVLRTGGRLVVNIDAIVNHEDDDDKEYFRPIYADLVNQMRRIDGMHFRGDVCWFKHQVVGRATAWGSYCSCSNPVIRRNHEYLLIWSKDQWNLPGDPEQSDMTDEEFQAWTMSFWHIAPENRKLGKHPVPFPEELTRRVIKLNSYRGDLVIDPFNGSGTTTSMAAGLRRRFIGIDNHMPYAEYAIRRTRQQISEIVDDVYISRSQRIKENKKNKEDTSEAEINFEN